jgi:hypothetical protein
VCLSSDHPGGSLPCAVVVRLSVSYPSSRFLRESAARRARAQLLRSWVGKAPSGPKLPFLQPTQGQVPLQPGVLGRALSRRRCPDPFGVAGPAVGSPVLAGRFLRGVRHRVSASHSSTSRPHSSGPAASVEDSRCVVGSPASSRLASGSMPEAERRGPRGDYPRGRPPAVAEASLAATPPARLSPVPLGHTTGWHMGPPNRRLGVIGDLPAVRGSRRGAHASYPEVQPPGDAAACRKPSGTRTAAATTFDTLRPTARPKADGVAPLMRPPSESSVRLIWRA